MRSNLHKTPGGSEFSFQNRSSKPLLQNVYEYGLKLDKISKINHHQHPSLLPPLPPGSSNNSRIISDLEKNRNANNTSQVFDLETPPHQPIKAKLSGKLNLLDKSPGSPSRPSPFAKNYELALQTPGSIPKQEITVGNSPPIKGTFFPSKQVEQIPVEQNQNQGSYSPMISYPDKFKFSQNTKKMFFNDYGAEKEKYNTEDILTPCKNSSPKMKKRSSIMNFVNSAMPPNIDKRNSNIAAFVSNNMKMHQSKASNDFAPKNQKQIIKENKFKVINDSVQREILMTSKIGGEPEKLENDKVKLQKAIQFREQAKMNLVDNEIKI